MKVALDITNLHKFSKSRGIGYYAKNLFESLKKYTNLDVKLVQENGIIDADLIHYPFFDLFRPTLNINKKIPFVVTVHDVTPLLFPKAYPKGIKGTLNLYRQKISLKKAKAIITDSDSSKKDISNLLRIDKEKIFTVHLSFSENFKNSEDKKFSEKIKNKYNLPNNFVLYVGSVNWNKNLINTTQAAIESNTDLVLIGKGFEIKDNLDHPELKSYSDFLNKYEGHSKVHILGFVPDEELVEIMSFAKALMFVSRYEGFGLPILEAQACGLPVITSNISSMPEVAGKGAILVDPDSITQIADAIKKTDDSSCRENLKKLGLENLKRFSWEKTAKETLKVYEYALKE